MRFRIISVPIFSLFLFAAGTSASYGQCGVGYTQAQTNWDNLDYYWNSGGGNAPYINYITDAWEQAQKFAIGSNYLTIATSSNALVNPGVGLSAENATHTGDLAGYTGEDVQYNPTANGQTITITFNNQVTNASFTLYDIDLNQVISVAAVNNLSVPQVVNVATQPGTILAIGGIFPLPTTITANGTALANNLNTGSATITVAGPVKSITLTITTVGTDAVFWLSDINACVTGSFPTQYNRTGNNQPMTGPVTNQPDYFIVTPDNQSVYMLDPATGQARFLFTDASSTYVNSFGYDPYNHILYYVTDGSGGPQNNKQLKKYDFNTDASSVVIADISATLGIPTFNQGVESAAAAFYDGALYLGIEGGREGSSGSTVTRETIMWRLDFSGGVPNNAYQVFATNAYLNATNTSIHDFGDFVIKNGILYDFNTARNSSNYSQSKYHQYNLMTGNLDNLYNNPGTTSWNGQAGLAWSEGLYYFRGISGLNSGVGTYDGAGNNGAIVTITKVGGAGPSWPGGAGDASENFRPKCDFGDAPATYDPNAISPAVHEREDTVRLGAAWTREWVKSGLTGTEDSDDGVTFMQVLQPGGGGFVAQVSVFNNRTTNATLIAWLDYNGNGIFDASEAITPITVTPSASSQSFWLYWASTPNSFVSGQSTYLRIRITPTSAGMTTSHATGYFAVGEVEDYRVIVDNYALTVKLNSFDVTPENNEVARLTWSGNEEQDFVGYAIERSQDSRNWEHVEFVNSSGPGRINSYEYRDVQPYKGLSYYRLRLLSNGSTKYSDIRKVSFKDASTDIVITPNPSSTVARISLQRSEPADARIRILNVQGSVVYNKTIYVNQAASVELPVYQWPAGTYTVQVSINNELISKKLIINK